MTPILHLTPSWSERPMDDPRGEIVACVRRSYDGTLSATLSLPNGRGGRMPLGFPVRVGSHEGAMHERGGMVAWGLRRLGPGVWAVAPSIHEPSVLVQVGGRAVPLHAYVVLCDVPEPAPFLDGEEGR